MRQLGEQWNYELILGDCIEKMKDIPDNSIDMVMTSPPYDNVRDYGKDFTGWENTFGSLFSKVYSES